MMNKAYQFRIYPNTEQQILINKTFGCCRFVYNKMLGEKIEHYKQKKENLNVTPAKYKSEFEWLKEVDSLALANVQMNLNAAYRNFFRNPKIGFPKFKSRRKDRKSYTTNCVNNNIRMVDDKIQIPKLGQVKIKKHRNIPQDYKLKSATISRPPSGEYYVSILFEYEKMNTQREIITAVGLDYSMTELYVSSDNEFAHYPKFYRQSQEKLAREQRKLSKMQKGSSNSNKQRKKVAKIHRRVTNCRKDFLHKQSRKIANSYDLVCIKVFDNGIMRSEKDLEFPMYHDLLTCGPHL